jgi:hypothetical protein
VTTKRGQLAVLRRVFDPEMVQYAQIAFPDRTRETEAERMIRERKEAERTARFRAARDTRDALLSGVYGAEAKKKARAMVTEKGADHVATLKYCAKLANDVRKSAHYRSLALQRKAVP